MIDYSLLMTWVKPVAIVTGVLILGWLFKVIVLVWVGKLTAMTETKLDDVVIDTLRKHTMLWFLLLGLVVGVRYAPVPVTVPVMLGQAALAIFLFSISWAISGIASYILEYYGKKRSLEVSTLSLTQNLLRLIILSLGILLILSNLGISITPLLTALGVGSLAVALALQDTLSNLFAGFYMIISRHVHVGDYIQLDSGQEGYVMDIGWRSCTIRQLAGNLVIIPNQKLGQAIIVNFDKPAKDLGVRVDVGVAYASDLDQVERITLEVAISVMQEVAGGVPNAVPTLRFHTLGDSSIQFSVALRAKEFADRYLVTHEFIKRLQKRYRQEGIEMPFPQRVVHLQQ